MKVVVLAAGKGTRMEELTKDKAKVMIDVNGKPFFHYLLKTLEEAGFTEAGIIVGYKKDTIIDFFGSRYGKLNLTYMEQKEQLGTGHATRTAQDFAGSENFILLMADNLYSPRDLKAIAKNDSFCYIAGMVHKNPEKYGVLVKRNGCLERIEEKPKTFVGNVINTGLYKLTPEIFKALDRIEKSPRGEYEITDALTLLAKQKKVRVFIIQDYWLDFGCKDDIPRIAEFLSKPFKEQK